MGEVVEPGVVLLAEGLEHSFGAVRALAGLSFRVAAGELYGLIGADGAGKTTALRILAGLMRPGRGTARIAGKDPADARSGVRELLGYMPQRYSLYGDLSVGENLRFFAELFCLDRRVFAERSERLLGITRLARFIDRPAEKLSGGMYKKLALACALLHRPEVLLLDEPTNGVDPVSRLDLWELLYGFVAEGMSVVVSTPYMDEAERCHRVGLLHGGRLLLEGAPERLVGGFEGVVLRVTGDLEKVERQLEGAGVIAVAPLGGSLRVVVGAEAAGPVEAELRGLGAEVERLRPNFEDLFLARAGGEGLPFDRAQGVRAEGAEEQRAQRGEG
ncbi:MAG: ABC transporter ATP-binding protein [Deltaproteobacteria bacterium]|nr:ABC transporter ATP-binding protein [Deltaproteobacteria bacterium]